MSVHDQPQPLFLPSRPRRLRAHAPVRAAVAETVLRVEELVCPLFFHTEAVDCPIASLPGLTRWSPSGLVAQVGWLQSLGIRHIALFGKCPDALKSRDGREAWHEQGFYCQAIRAIRAAHPAVVIYTDVALDPYSSDGHDGYINDAGEVDNDITLGLLCRQALAHARAGAQFVAPSDMMDGRVGALRAALDAAGFSQVGLLSYCAKYASGFYGPFRGALDSAPRETGDRPIPADKRSYQMDPANRREALREMHLDQAEGADLLMVKPAGLYLDVIADLARESSLPIAAYQVSGEYAMLWHAAEAGAIDLRTGVLESLLAIRRAGAKLIYTYFAPQVALWLRDEALSPAR